MTELEKAELKKILVKWIREDKDVYQALLDWAAFNPYIEFKAALEDTRKLMRKRASAADLFIPESFGFPQDEIPDKDLPALMRRLDVMALVLQKSIDAGVREITLLSPTGGQTVERKDPLVDRDPITVELTGDFHATIKLLHALNLPSDVVTFERVTAQSVGTEGDLLKVTAVVAGLEVHPEVQLKRKKGSRKKGGKTPWGGLGR